MFNNLMQTGLIGTAETSSRNGRRLTSNSVEVKHGVTHVVFGPSKFQPISPLFSLCKVSTIIRNGSTILEARLQVTD